MSSPRRSQPSLLQAHQIGNDLRYLILGQVGIRHAVRLIEAAMGFLHEIRQRLRGDVLALHDRCERRCRRMQNRLGVLIGRRQMTKGANLDRQVMTLADIVGCVALLGPR